MIISRLFFGLARPALTSQLSASFAYASHTRSYSNIRSKYQSSHSEFKAAETSENFPNSSKTRRVRSISLTSAHHQSTSAD
jgi:hypothetical protein